MKKYYPACETSMYTHVLYNICGCNCPTFINSYERSLKAVADPAGGGGVSGFNLDPRKEFLEGIII